MCLCLGMFFEHAPGVCRWRYCTCIERRYKSDQERDYCSAGFFMQTIFNTCGFEYMRCSRHAIFNSWPKTPVSHMENDHHDHLTIHHPILMNHDQLIIHLMNVYLHNLHHYQIIKHDSINQLIFYPTFMIVLFYVFLNLHNHVYQI